MGSELAARLQPLLNNGEIEIMKLLFALLTRTCYFPYTTRIFISGLCEVEVKLPLVRIGIRSVARTGGIGTLVRVRVSLQPQQQ